MWDKETVVVSFGEVRRFHFRKIDDKSDNEQEHFTYRLFEGDVVLMYGSCQDDYQHAVMKGESEYNNDGRISIVFKKSIPGIGGRRGHGIPNQQRVQANVQKTQKPIPKKGVQIKDGRKKTSR